MTAETRSRPTLGPASIGGTTLVRWSSDCRTPPQCHEAGAARYQGPTDQYHLDDIGMGVWVGAEGAAGVERTGWMGGAVTVTSGAGAV